MTTPLEDDLVAGIRCCEDEEEEGEEEEDGVAMDEVLDRLVVVCEERVSIDLLLTACDRPGLLA